MALVVSTSFRVALLGTLLSLSSSPHNSTTMPPQPISDDSGNHVFREEINRYAVDGTKRPGNDARRIVLRETPRQQIGRLDKRLHKIARNHWQEGTYPSNYDVRDIFENTSRFIDIVLDHQEVPFQVSQPRILRHRCLEGRNL
jgi:hypothetical protein